MWLDIKAYLHNTFANIFSPSSSLSLSSLVRSSNFHSFVFPALYFSFFVSVTHIQSETHSRDRSGQAVLSLVTYFAEVVSAGLLCILMQ